MLPLHWFLIRPCGLCGAPLETGTPSGDPLCQSCRSLYGLPADGLCGHEPIRWWGAGLYAGALRELLLRLRRHPCQATMRALTTGLAASLRGLDAAAERSLLVPVPSWKRRGNPLPGLVCRTLTGPTGLRRADLLERSRPVLGQHHLGRTLRLANQAGAFHCLRPPGPGDNRRRPVLIVDDILTSGATIGAAAAALRQAGWRVRGAVCLARTPARSGPVVL